MMNTDNFWNDELVKEFHTTAMSYYNQGHSFYSAVEVFKISKQKTKEHPN